MIAPLHAGEVRWFMPGALRAGDVVHCAGHSVRVPTLTGGGVSRDFAWGGGTTVSLAESNGAVEIACDAAASRPSLVGVPARDIVGQNGLDLIRGANRLATLERVYGEPTTVRSGAGLCVVVWSAIGLRAVLRGERCAATSVLASATVHGSRWRSLSGVRVGDPLAKLVFQVRGARRIDAHTWLLGTGGQYRSELVASIGPRNAVTGFTATLQKPPR